MSEKLTVSASRRRRRWRSMMAVAAAVCVTAVLTGVTFTAHADTTIIFPPGLPSG